MKAIFLIVLKLPALLLGILPESVGRSIGWCLGSMLWVLGFRRTVLRENLMRVFPERSVAELRVIERKNYVHYGHLLVEFFRSFAGFRKYLHERCTIEGGEHIYKALEQGKGVFVMTAHLGNWELLASHGSVVMDVPITMVTKPLRPSWFHKMVEEGRASLGTRMAYEPQTMRRIMRALRDKEIVGFAVDQFTGAPVGARVPFFGVPVGSTTALAVLAARTNAPIVPGFAVRKPSGGFTVFFDEPLPLLAASDSAESEGNALEQDILARTAQQMAYLEKWIQRYPEQWMWIHRRWKGDLSPLRPGSPGELCKADS